MEDDEKLARSVVDAAVEVHRALGPGVLESVYRKCLVKELNSRGVRVAEEVPLRAEYKGLVFDSAYRMDLLVEGRVVVELKTVEALQPVHPAQLLSYLRLSGRRLGLLLNFNVPLMKNGIRRIINSY